MYRSAGAELFMAECRGEGGKLSLIQKEVGCRRGGTVLSSQSAFIATSSTSFLSWILGDIYIHINIYIYVCIYIYIYIYTYTYIYIYK